MGDFQKKEHNTNNISISNEFNDLENRISEGFNNISTTYGVSHINLNPIFTCIGNGSNKTIKVFTPTENISVMIVCTGGSGGITYIDDDGDGDDSTASGGGSSAVYQGNVDNLLIGASGGKGQSLEPDISEVKLSNIIISNVGTRVNVVSWQKIQNSYYGGYQSKIVFIPLKKNTPYTLVAGGHGKDGVYGQIVTGGEGYTNGKNGRKSQYDGGDGGYINPMFEFSRTQTVVSTKTPGSIYLYKWEE